MQTMPRKPTTPDPIEIANVRARAERPPLSSNPGRWWWRARTIGRHGRKVWTGRGTRDEVSAILVGLVANGLPAPADVERCDTVEDLLAFWMGDRTTAHEANLLRKRTLIAYGTRRGHLKRVLGHIPMAGLTGRDLRDYVRTRKTERAADVTVAGELAALQGALNFGRLERLHDLDLVVPKFVNPKPARKKVTPTRGDVADALEQLDGWTHVAVVLGFATGMRVGEISALTWSDVDLERAELTVPKSGKTGSRWVPLGEHAVEVLEAWRETQLGDDPRLLGVAPSTVTTQLCRALQAAGCRWTFHGLRRLAVDEMARNGVDPATAASITGHSVKTMMKHYRSVTDDDRRKAIVKARLGALPRGKVLTLGGD
jgi:integrase